MRGFTTEAKLEYHDDLKASGIKLLLSIIEGPVDCEIYQQIAVSMDDFVILTKRMEIIYDRFVEELFADDPNNTKPLQDITREEVTVAVKSKKDSFQGKIIEGFDIYCLINQLALTLPEVSEKIKER